MPRGDYSSDSVTLVPGFLRGFRAWGLGFQFDQPTLVGAVQTSFAWQPGRNEASCPGPALTGAWPTRIHSAPGPRCGCGFYARFDEEHGYIGVKGIVKVTGDIVLGTKGFRAQYAEIEAFYLDDEGLSEYLHCVRTARSVPPFGLGRVNRGYEAGGELPSWGRGKTAADLLEYLATDYKVKIYPSAAAAQEDFPFPSVEGLLPPEPEPVPEPLTHAWPPAKPLVWGPPLPWHREKLLKRTPIKLPFKPRHWRTK